MKFHQKLIFAITIFILAYIIWRAYNSRQFSLENFELPTIIGQPSQSSELTSLKKTTPINIQNIAQDHANLPLREYCIKGSYNSAYTGHYINLEMIEYVLARGCRFLDFEVYYINENDKYIPKVGFSTDNTFTMLNSENSILLDNVLSSATASAFSSKTSNNKDPLFIHLRIKSNNGDVYNSVAKSIDYSIKPLLYKEAVTNDTLLREIMGKVVIIIDKSINRDYSQYNVCNTRLCYVLTDYTNMESGSETLNIVKYTDLLHQRTTPIQILDSKISTDSSISTDSKISTDVKKMKLALPDIIPNTTENPKIMDCVLKYGCQVVPNRFYYPDKQLEKYETFFDDNKSAFVPLSTALPYYQKIKDLYA